MQVAIPYLIFAGIGVVVYALTKKMGLVHQAYFFDNPRKSFLGPTQFCRGRFQTFANWVNVLG